MGIPLFFLCDDFIGIRMMLPSDAAIYPFIRFMVWVFYIPSRAILSLSDPVDRIDARAEATS